MDIKEKFAMPEYEFERVSACKGVFVGKSLDHQEIIRRRGAEGWRFCGYVPAAQASGFITQMDLVFEREGKTHDTAAD